MSTQADHAAQVAHQLADRTAENLERQLRASLIATFDVRYSPGYCCWIATEQSYDSPESPLGHGATRDEAIDDLIETLESRRNRKVGR